MPTTVPMPSLGDFMSPPVLPEVSSARSEYYSPNNPNPRYTQVEMAANPYYSSHFSPLGLRARLSGSSASTAAAEAEGSHHGFIDSVTSGLQNLINEYNKVITDQNTLTYQRQLEAAERANEMYKENLALNAKYTRDLRSTYYQDQVASLRAAGLNPVLAYSGSGSGNPSVSAQGFQASGSGINNVINTDAVADYFGTFVSSSFALGGDLLKSISSLIGSMNMSKTIASSAKARSYSGRPSTVTTYNSYFG